MKKTICVGVFLVGLIISANMIVSGHNTKPEKSEIRCLVEFNPREYKGRIYVNGDYLPPRHYRKLLTQTNNYFEIGGKGDSASQITFEVTDDCKVKSNEGKGAVVFSGNVITFRNVSIEVDPQEFGGEYFMKGFKDGPIIYTPFRSNETFTVVPNIPNFISLYATGIKSEIYFDVDANGNISNVRDWKNEVGSASAYVSGNKLILNNTRIKIAPRSYSRSFKLGGVTGYKGIQDNFIAIPNVFLPIEIIQKATKYIKPKENCIEIWELEGESFSPEGDCKNPKETQLWNGSSRYRFEISLN